jgi:glycosyltransferase involved in cell wall biosynthesis
MNRLARILGRATGIEVILRNGVALADHCSVPLHAEHPTIGTAGIMRAKKGIDTVLRACKQVARSIPNLDLRLIGAFRDSEQSYWLQLLDATGMRPKTQISGVLPHIEAVKAIGELDVYVHASLYDGCPNALLEAAAAERPIICARTASSSEILEDGNECLMFEPGDVCELGATIMRLLHDRPAAREMGKRARTKVANNFSLQGEIQCILDLYRQIGVKI